MGNGVIVRCENCGQELRNAKAICASCTHTLIGKKKLARPDAPLSTGWSDVKTITVGIYFIAGIFLIWFGMQWSDVGIAVVVQGFICLVLGLGVTNTRSRALIILAVVFFPLLIAGGGTLVVVILQGGFAGSLSQHM